MELGKSNLMFSSGCPSSNCNEDKLLHIGRVVGQANAAGRRSHQSSNEDVYKDGWSAGRTTGAHRAHTVHGLAVVGGMGDCIGVRVPEAAGGGPHVLPLLLLQLHLRHPADLGMQPPNSSFPTQISQGQLMAKPEPGLLT